MSRVFQNFKDAAMFAKEQSVKSKKLHLVKRIEDNWVVLSKNEKKTMIEWGLFSCLGCSNKNQDIVLFKALDDHYNWSLICNNCGSSISVLPFLRFLINLLLISIPCTVCPLEAAITA